jgi:hypothetical protein
MKNISTPDPEHATCTSCHWRKRRGNNRRDKSKSQIWLKLRCKNWENRRYRINNRIKRKNTRSVGRKCNGAWDYEAGGKKVADRAEYKLGLKGRQNHFKIRVMNKQITYIYHGLYHNKQACIFFISGTNKQTNFMVWVRERTIPTKRLLLVGEVIANFCG